MNGLNLLLPSQDVRCEPRATTAANDSLHPSVAVLPFHVKHSRGRVHAGRAEKLASGIPVSPLLSVYAGADGNAKGILKPLPAETRERSCRRLQGSAVTGSSLTKFAAAAGKDCNEAGSNRRVCTSREFF